MNHKRPTKFGSKPGRPDLEIQHALCGVCPGTIDAIGLSIGDRVEFDAETLKSVAK